MDSQPLAIEPPSGLVETERLEALETPASSEFGLPVSVTVEELTGGREAEWDAWVADAPGATFFHRTAWLRAVYDVYGHKPVHLVARNVLTRRIRGVLPLFAVNGPLTGRGLVSIPYAVSGGAVADNDDVEARLVAAAQRQAESLGVAYLELRKASSGDRMVWRDHYHGFRTALPADPDAVLGRFPRKARAEIRKARDQFGLTARFGHDLLSLFHGLYVRSLRRLGSPAHSWRFLRWLVDTLGDDCLIEVVWHDETPVAAVMAFRFRDQVLPYYAGIDDRYNHWNTSNFLYFSLMEQAVRLGLRVYDFGRTRKDNTGGCQFKINQGFAPEPMVYSYYSPGGQEAPDLRPSNAGYSRAQAIWRRLPLCAAGPLGGVVSRWLP
jgi:FemAB-related protein (PEP-CTERM system-associated)